MGDKKIFMQLSDGKVQVRSGGGSSNRLVDRKGMAFRGYVPLAQWTRELEPAPRRLTRKAFRSPEEGDDPFSSLQSPFAAVRA